MAAKRLNTKSCKFALYTEALSEILPLMLFLTAAVIIWGMRYPEISWSRVYYQTEYLTAQEIAGKSIFFSYLVPFIFIYRLFSFLWDSKRADFYLSTPHSLLSICLARLSAAFTGQAVCVLLPITARMSFLYAKNLLIPHKMINILCENAVIMLSFTALSLAGLLIARKPLGGAAITVGFAYCAYLLNNCIYAVMCHCGLADAVQPVYETLKKTIILLSPFHGLHGYNHYSIIHFAVLLAAAALILTVCFIYMQRRLKLAAPAFAVKITYITALSVLAAYFSIQLTANKSFIWIYLGLIIIILPAVIKALRRKA